jgi:nucleotide-binding universal stress UspA family protein
MRGASSASGPLRVLVAIDGSPASRVAVDLVGAAKWPAGSVIRLVTAQLMEPAATFAGPAFVVAGHNLKAALAEQTAAILTDAEQRLQHGELLIEREILHGFPVDAIGDDAARFAADLLVIGSRGHGSLGSALLGSVSAGLVDRAQCPVLVARRPSLRRVMLAYDASAASRAALSIVASWPLFDSATVTVTSVAPPSVPTTAGDARDELQHAGRESRIVVASGDPATEILRAAEEVDADLVVTGSRGHVGLARLVLGSVARKVLLNSPASVLVVHPARSARG